MSKIILPDDPDFDKPIIMGNPFEVDLDRDLNKQAITPGTKKAAMDQQRAVESPGTFKYAETLASSAPELWHHQMMKTSQEAGVSNMMTQPMWFSPLHTPQNWQVASKRREVYQWSRFFYENEPKVAAAIDFYCFAPETQILMSNGAQKSISSIEPGDLVRSHDGTVNQVVRTFARKTDELMLSISIAGVSLGQSLRVTEGHELLTKKNGEIKFVQAQCLKEGDYLLTPVEYSDSISDKMVDPDFAWLLGIYAAEGCGMPYEHTSQDGHYSSYYKGVYFTFNFEEEILVEKTVSAIHRLYGDNKVTVRKIEEDGIQRVAAYGKNIADDLVGLCPGMAKDGTKRFAPIVMKFGTEDLTHLLAGFLDGDGCFNKNNGFQGVGVSKSLSEQIANICDKLGIEYSFTSTRISKDNRQTCYNVRISRRACSLLEGLTYKINDNCVDESKMHNTPYCKEGKYIFRKIRSIKTQNYVGTVYDLEIENSHSYVANRISCHNSRFPMNGFKLECLNPKILKYYAHHIVKKLNLNERFKEISSEYYMIGDVFVHTDIKCEICGGVGEDPDTGEKCDHPGGTLSRIFIMNPDWIEVQRSPLTDEPLIVLIPDEELQQIVHKRQPKAIFDRIPDHLKQLILARAPIPLSNRTISHLKHMNVPYGTYGTSIIRRLFTTLAYKTKIMTANWIVAERLILPVRVVKIGSDNRPAATQDIADVQTQLANVANDPNMTIVTHHNFEYDWYGCVSSCPASSYVMTAQGRVHHNDLIKDDLIATWNAQTGKIEYQNYLRNIEFDYNKQNSNGFAYRVGNQYWSGDFTPNHRHYLSNGYIKRSDELKIGDEIVNASQWNWRGKIPRELPYHNYPGDEKFGDGFESLGLEDFCRFAGYFVTEGHIKHERSKNLNKEVEGQAFAISQNVDAGCYNDINDLMFKISSKCYVTTDERRAIPNHQFNIANAPLSRAIEEEFGSGSINKHLPSWMLQLPEEYLRVLLDALVKGDGDSNRNRFTTVSPQLRDQFMEILMKLGFSPYSMTEKIDHENRNDIFRILWSSHMKPRKFKINIVEKIPYDGKMWCLEMPNKNFFIEVDGHIFLTGNTQGKILQVTQEMEHIDKELLDGLMLNQALLNGEMSGYQSAQVGVETLIRRIEAWRQTLAEWAEERIFKPIAEMQGFIDEKESEEVGETVFLYPTIKWNELELKDKTQFHQLLNQLHDKQVISTQTLLEEFGFDYDQEVMRMRYEQAQAGPAGAMMPGAEGGAGGMPMGGGGGMPGAEGGAGGMPGMGMDPMGGMGGGMDMGGGMGGGMPAAAGGGKVTKKGKSNTSEEEEAVPMVPIKLTKIEQKMAGMLNEVATTMGFSASNIRMQYPFANPKGGKPFTMDFAFPTLKVDIEADGEIWHSGPEKMQHDKDRDYLLAQRGWTVLRFDDKVIEEAPHQVKATINSYIKKAMESTQKIASGNNGVQLSKMVGYFISEGGDLKDLQGNAVKYYKTLENTHDDRIVTSTTFGNRSSDEYFSTARKI